MKSVIALFLTGSMLLSSSAIAKKITPPAPNLAASVNITMSVEAEATPPADPLMDVNTNVSVSHSFTLTPNEEAALQADAIVSVLDNDLTLGNDPNFQNGDKSASFNVALPLGFVGITVPCQATLKWNKGKMTVTLKGKLIEKDVPADVISARQKAAAQRDIFPIVITTEIAHSSISTLVVNAPLACDVEMSQTQGATAEGTEFMKFGQTIKSKAFTTMPEF